MLWSGALTLTIAAALAGPPAAAAATGRVWELVTPPDPNGRAINGVASVTPDGDRVAYVSAGPMPGAPSGSQASYNLATRTPNGWQSAPLGFPYSVAGGLFAAVPAPVAAADGLSSWVWSSQRPLLPGAPESPITGIYSGGVGGPPTLLAGGESAEVYGTSADARTVVLQTTTALLPADVRSTGRQV